MDSASPLAPDTSHLAGSQRRVRRDHGHVYHDQGHIAIKLLAMHRAVNVTLGLPIVRTSVAHGTAFDLAWQGGAESSGMVEALRVASRLAVTRRRLGAQVRPTADALLRSASALAVFHEAELLQMLGRLVLGLESRPGLYWTSTPDRWGRRTGLQKAP